MGVIISFVSQSFPPKPAFNPERDIPDLTGKVVIVTGGNTGIGFHTVEELLKKNAKVYMASRTQSRAEEAIVKLRQTTGKEAIFLQLDLADLHNISQAANDFKSKESELHILFNSAGVMFSPIDQLTRDGYDLQFGTNVLGHAHLTLSLLPQLLEGAKSSPDGKARVINTASSAVYLAPKGGINWDTLRDDTNGGRGLRRSFGGKHKMYLQSKMGNVIFSNELARRYADQGIVSNACNPGNLRTELYRHIHPVLDFFVRFALYPAPYGALTQLWGGTSPETRDLNGAFLVPWARVAPPPRAEVRDVNLGSRLWEWIEEQRKGH